MFSPTLGRWLTEDPITFAGGDVNLFRTVSNNPLNRLYLTRLGLRGDRGFRIGG